LELSAGGVGGIRRCFTERGLEGCVRRKDPVREYRTKLDGEQEARRLAERLEIHQTPNHGSWLNRAKIEQSVLVRQALRRHIPTASGMRRRVATWAAHRNASEATVEWPFTTGDARIKLKRPYPVVET
jgi:hypothetical protein